ncbi:MAG TPA: choice-of-anchor D domain-containing protein [Casimicrobiaceae bacterium]
MPQRHQLFSNRSRYAASAVLSILCYATPIHAAPGLVSPLPGASKGVSPDVTVVRQRPVAVNLQGLDPGSAATPRQLSLDLFDGLTVTLDLNRAEVRAPGNYSWFGSVRGYPNSSAILTTVNGMLSASIDLGPLAGASYRIEPGQSGQQSLRQINPGAFPPDHPPGGAPVAPNLLSTGGASAGDATGGTSVAATTSSADSGATIDVMVVYSNQTAAAAGAGIATQIQQAIDTANAVYANSGITTRLRLAHYEQVNYNETGDYPTDLNWLTSNATVASLRNTYAADLVSMLVEETQYCGYGWIGPSAGYGFSVINRGCASANYSFPHELGHNFGARHDTYVDSTTTPYAYGHGWVDVNESWRDVMAYNNACAAVGKNCTRVPYFSNPNMTYGSPADPLGTTATADVVLVHNQNAYTVANFRVSGASGCSYALSPSSASAAVGGGSGSFGVTAASGCAWNATSNAGAWLTIAAGSGTSGNGTLNYTVAANSGGARSGTIAVGGVLFTVNQASGCAYGLSPGSASMGAGAGSGSTTLTTASGCSWTASSSTSWLSVTSATSGTGGATVGYAASANTGGSRSANLTVGGATFVITQAAAAATPPAAALSSATLNFGNVVVGRISGALSVTLKNSGGGTLSVASLTAGGANPADFIRSGTCAVNIALSAGQSCSISYTFSPSATGTRSATLAVGTNANSVTLNLSGNGTTKPGKGGK